MSELEFKKLHCSNCGKLLGYVYIRSKTFPPQELYRLFVGQPHRETEITVFCPECYSKTPDK